jgi:transposase, IS30 family
MSPRRRVQGLERRGRITNMTMVADRPAEVSDRVQVGRWEGDCIMGAGNRSAIGTLVERTTRFVILIHVPTGRPTAAAMRDGITDALVALAPDLRRTLTWDQGKELARHHQITANTGTRVVLLRRALAVAERQQREHERLATRLLPQSH